MTTHVVCLDGTDQVKLQAHPTNISKIFDALGGSAVDAGNGSWETVAPDLCGKYLPGVGSQGDLILRALGNAFGDGIAEPIVRGYTFLSRQFRAGDQIVITGFSRGAAAARALAGFIAGCGLLDPAKYPAGDSHAGYLRAIAAWYAYRREKPDLANQARLALMELKLGMVFPRLEPADFVPVPAITAVGVFDTVSSLGLPHVDAQGDAVFDFTICDSTLSPKVQHGFHALAADETRDLFAPTFWAARDDVVQEIFPGAHSNVGGGYPERGLSDGALSWMLDKLKSVGVACDPARVQPSLAPNPLDPARDEAVVFPFKDTPRRPRRFPTTAGPGAALLARWGQPAEVLPGDAVTPYRALGVYADGAPLH